MANTNENKSNVRKVEVDVLIQDGLIVMKTGEKVKPLTNWAPSVVAVAKQNGVIVGAVIQHPPKSVTCDESKRNWKTYLTMNEMSTHFSISQKLKNNECYTFYCHAKDQYLPEILTAITEKYAQRDDAIILTPLESIGRQDRPGYPLYAFPSVFGMRFFSQVDGNVIEISEEDAQLVVTNDNFGLKLKLPRLFSDENTIANLLAFWRNTQGKNFSSACFVLGGVALALHYGVIIKKFGNCPVPMLFGSPCSSKTTAMEVGMASVGVMENYHDPTYAGILQALSTAAVPIWWEDVECFATAEKIIMMVYNKSERMTSKTGVKLKASSMPVCTTNGLFLQKISQNEMKRFNGRVCYIPFEPITNDFSLKQTVEFKVALTAIKEQAPNAFPDLLSIEHDISELNGDILDMCSDLIKDILQLDPRSILNYGILIYITYQLLRKAGEKEDDIKEIVRGFLSGPLQSFMRDSFRDSISLEDLKQLLHEGSNHVEASKFMKIVKTRGCECGRCYAVSLTNINKFLNYKYTSTDLKHMREKLVQHGLGCKGKRMTVNEHEINCVHVKLIFLPELEQLLLSAEKVTTVETVETVDNDQPLPDPGSESIPCLHSNEGCEKASSKNVKRKKVDLEDGLSSAFQPSDTRRRKK